MYQFPMWDFAVSCGFTLLIIIFSVANSGERTQNLDLCSMHSVGKFMSEYHQH